VVFGKDDKTEKVTLYNISVVNKENMDEIFDQTFKYIFEHTKCTQFMLKVNHMTQEDGTIKLDP